MVTRQMVAECVGLWLAEGDRKSESEITFTNSEPYLIRFFHECLRKLLSDNDFHVYSYSKSGRAEKPCNAAYIKCYIDKRARKPYYILRLCRTELVKKWSKIVRKIVPDKALWPHILRGFFAGEGNIKTGKHHSRQLRIAQGRENPSIERMLKHVGIGFRYSGAERSYVISGFWNWEIFAKYCISDLHPLKKARFWSVFRTFKQRHYKAHHIRNELLIMLKTPATTAHLAGYFKRSMARVQEILVDLKKEGLVNTFRAGSSNYWTTRKDIVIVSRRKLRYLNAIARGVKKTSEVAAEIEVGWKAARNRLVELKNLGLIYDEEGKWCIQKNLPNVLIR